MVHTNAPIKLLLRIYISHYKRTGQLKFGTFLNN